MSRSGASLLDLLPSLYRARDAEFAAQAGLERGPIEELLEVFARELSATDDHLAQLYEDLFVETCAEWVVPYLGDLIGYEALHGDVPDAASRRAEVAHTIALRRRKGTASVLEQLARDVTGWDARANEYFARLVTTQYMNHVRPAQVQCPDLRRGSALQWHGTAFEGDQRTVDVRHVESGRGRHNIPNVGIHLWRIRSYERRETPAVQHAPHRYRFSPLNRDLPLYNRPRTATEISQLASPEHVPWPLSRRRADEDLALHYGERASLDDALSPADASFSLTVAGTPVARDRIRICNLSDSDGLGNWAHTPLPADTYAIDPVLGRIALPPGIAADAAVHVSWHEGFSADLGGGEYPREDGFEGGDADLRVPDDHPTLSAALAALGGAGVIEVTDSERYAAPATIALAGEVVIRAANGRRPVLDGTWITVTGGGRLVLEGLLLMGALRVPEDGDAAPTALTLNHCTAVPPGIPTSAAEDPTISASLLVSKGNASITLARSIIGPVRCEESVLVSAVDSVIDAGAASAVAYAAAHEDEGPGGTLSLEACTTIGKVHMRSVDTISNSILFATLSPGDGWTSAVRSTRKQVGCVRFSWLPWASAVPPRYRCQPDGASAAERIAPQFNSLTYGTPTYLQLAHGTAEEISRGADDDSEMGVLHHLHAAQREANLSIRLREYLRVGLSAGIFYES